MNNDMVLCVNILHAVGGMVEIVRQRTRATVLNKRHVHDIWGDDRNKEINTPRIIDDYNH